MSNKFENWERRLNECTEKIVSEFGQMSAEQLNQKPDAQTWSIAQNIDHLIAINKSYYPIVEQIRAGKYQVPFLGRFGFVARFFGNFILKAVQPQNKKKMKTFPVWEPSKSNISGDIVQQFVAHQKEFIAFMHSCKDLVEKGQVICSPASRTVVYTLERAFEIIVAHEERHWEQAQALNVEC